MVLKKLSKALAATATAAMMVSPMMAMAAEGEGSGSPEQLTVKELENKGLVDATYDNAGNLTALEVTAPGAQAGLLDVEISGQIVFLVIDENKQWDSDFSTTNAAGNVVTPYAYNGEEFICDAGIVQTWTDGIVTDANGAYFVAAGRVVKEADVAEYDGFWFVLKNGRVDATFTGPKTFKDAEGKDVTALFAAGRMLKEFTGITDDPSGTKYFVEEGVIRTDLSGTVTVDGVAYTIENGIVK